MKTYTQRLEACQLAAPATDIVFVDDYGAMIAVLDMASRAERVIGSLGILRDMAPDTELDQWWHLTVQYKDFMRACSMLTESGLSVALCIHDPVQKSDKLHCVWRGEPVKKQAQGDFWE